jgi:DNA-binding winged helix-turn-helix (wHTH) protein
MTALASGPIRFGPFELDPGSRELRKRGLRVRLLPQSMTLLCLLVQSPVRTRTREEIQQTLWPASGNTFVDFEHSLNRVVHSLREALGDSASDPRYIETVALEGYRFLPRIEDIRATPPSARLARAPNSIAVLPIETRGDEHLTGIANRLMLRLIDGLAHTAGMRVLAEATVKGHELKGISPKRAGELLEVGIVLAGELERTGDLLVLRVESIDTADGAQICAAQAERKSLPGAHCETALFRSILHQIKPRLARSMGRTEAPPASVPGTQRR